MDVLWRWPGDDAGDLATIQYLLPAMHHDVSGRIRVVSLGDTNCGGFARS